MNGNDERKMRELAERLAAMSPDAPPFPEETTMTAPSTGSPRFRPLTVFAGAALVVLLGLGIPLILMNDGSQLAGDTTTTSAIETTTTTDESTSTTVGDSSSTTAPTEPVAQFGTIAFMLQTPEGSFTGNPALVAFQTFVELPEGSTDLDVLKATLNGLAWSEPPDGYFTGVPVPARILDVRRADGTDNALIIDVNGAFVDGAGGALADFTMLNQLIYTATALPDIDEVQFIFDNEPITQFGSEGLDISSSLNRETFQEHLALINLTSPILPNADGNVVVEGRSNTFEATLALRITDAEGAIRHEEVTTATCGSGCWGDYMFVLDPSLLGDDSTVQLLEYSAEDGAPVNVISIRYNGGEPWDLLPES